MQQQLIIMSKEDFTIILDDVFKKFFGLNKPPYYSQNTSESIKGYTRNEVAILLKRSPNTISKYIRSKELDAKAIKGVYYIDESSVQKFLNSKTII